MIKASDMFFCYNKNLAQYIKSRGIYSITTAIHPTTGKMFTLFPKSEELQQALNEYHNHNHNQ
ncbi:DUF5659 domain-containing protein [Salibacterium lacus]|uniref:DUF5659 domain-containing protein n=1 Tax=Salibacterium lacus TaxID=1898109 RepID=A0ABW5SYH1_9BACI